MEKFHLTNRFLMAGMAGTMVCLVAQACEAAQNDLPETSAVDSTDAVAIEHLPDPRRRDGMPLQQALAQRRSIRHLREETLTPEQISQLCWAGQGISSRRTGYRTAPSAGALYPVVLFVVDERGLFEYEPDQHRLLKLRTSDLRAELQQAAIGQEAVGDAPVCIVIAYDPAAVQRKYGKRAERYCLLEVGHVAQNILLQATALGLGGVPVGAFDDVSIARVLNLPSRLRPVYVLPVGHPQADR